MPSEVEKRRKLAFAYLCREAIEEQRRVIYSFAAMSGIEIVREFEDIVGGGAIGSAIAPGFLTLLRLVGRRGIRTIIVDTAARFSNDAVNQVVAYLRLRERGVEVIAADHSFDVIKDNAQIGAVQQVLDVAKKIDSRIGGALGADGRKRRLSTGNEPRRKTYAEFAPKATALARRLHEESQKSGSRMSLREISAELALAGHVKGDGNPFHPEAIRRMINGRAPKKNDGDL